MSSSSAIRRGDVVLVRLDPAEGSEQAGRRSGLVVSPDLINLHSPVVLVAAITSRKTEKIYPFEVLVEAGEAGLTQKSKAMLMQLRALDKGRVEKTLGSIRADTLGRLDHALRVATGLVKF